MRKPTAPLRPATVAIMKKERFAWVSSRAFHIVVIIAGAALLLCGAFHGNIWFDESYSVGIASKSFSEIWRIGSGDVHPILYYWALHVIYLLGGGLDAYRVFSVFGSVCMALAGFTHLRRDWGWRVGLIFSFFALFLPYVGFISIEVRMYSWCSCMVMFAFIYALRIGRATGGTSTEGSGHARTSDWVFFALSSLAAAYLHYFGVISVFIINLGLLIHLMRRRRAFKRDARAFWIQAVAQVAAYFPWLFALVSQLSVVSNTYWVNFKFPDTLIALMRYPFITMQIDFAWSGDYGPAFRVIVSIIVILAVLLLIFIVLRLRQSIIRFRSRSRSTMHNSPWWRRAWRFIVMPEHLPGFLGLAVYFGLFAIAALASVLMHSLMLYFRYMFCAIGPLLFSLVWMLHRIDSNKIIAASCGLLLTMSLLNEALIVNDDYSPDNQAPMEYLEDNVQDGDLVLSSDIGVMGVTAVELPNIHQCYLNWQQGNWGLAYEAYYPTLEEIPGWECKLDDFHGTFWVLGQSSDGSRPSDVDNLLQKDGVTMVSSEVFYRPYERSYFTITCMHKA